MIGTFWKSLEGSSAVLATVSASFPKSSWRGTTRGRYYHHFSQFHDEEIRMMIKVSDEWFRSR